MTRECGACTACCTVLAVPTLNKPSGVTCDQVCAKGCAIYATKPEECTEFQCLWIGDVETLITREEDRPDVSGVCFTGIGGRDHGESFARRYGFPPLQGFEVWPGAFESYRAKKLLERVRRKAIIVMCPFRSLDRYVIGPEKVSRADLLTLQAVARRNAMREERDRLAGRLKVDASPEIKYSSTLGNERDAE